MSTLKGVPSGSRRISRIEMLNSPTNEARILLYRLRKDGEKMFPGINKAQVNYWSEDQIQSQKFKKRVRNKNTITIGIKDYPFSKERDVNKILGLKENTTQSTIAMALAEKEIKIPKNVPQSATPAFAEKKPKVEYTEEEMFWAV